MTVDPDCFVCGLPCCCDQRDGQGRAVHLGCQPSLPPQERHPRLAEHATNHLSPKGNHP